MIRQVMGLLQALTGAYPPQAPRRHNITLVSADKVEIGIWIEEKDQPWICVVQIDGEDLDKSAEQLFTEIVSGIEDLI